jgi:uncharacterized protein YndB with AHSA1/START domain
VTAPDFVRVTAWIDVEPEAAFALFTEEVDAWWKKGPRYRFGRGEEGVLRFEPGLGGRLVEVFDEETGEHFEVGRIVAWDPGARLAFQWRSPDFAAGEKTEVEVLFEAARGGTSVTVIHRGWDTLRRDHPVRRGYQGRAFLDMMGLVWADLATSLRAHASKA